MGPYDRLGEFAIVAELRVLAARLFFWSRRGVMCVSGRVMESWKLERCVTSAAAAWPQPSRVDTVSGGECWGRITYVEGR